jgi:hypothetical protein
MNGSGKQELDNKKLYKNNTQETGSPGSPGSPGSFSCRSPLIGFWKENQKYCDGQS